MIFKFHTSIDGWRFEEVRTVEVAYATARPNQLQPGETDVFYTREGEAVGAPVIIDLMQCFYPIDRNGSPVRIAVLTRQDGTRYTVAFDGPAYILNNDGKTIESFKSIN